MGLGLGLGLGLGIESAMKTPTQASNADNYAKYFLYHIETIFFLLTMNFLVAAILRLIVI
jgi:hypothetical protein